MIESYQAFEVFDFIWAGNPLALCSQRTMPEKTSPTNHAPGSGTRVKFWGVRGSIPTPGPTTIRYGGNTSCVEVRDSTGALLVLDAGTGLRELGISLMNSNGAKPLTVDLLISHLH